MKQHVALFIGGPWDGQRLPIDGEPKETLFVTIAPEVVRHGLQDCIETMAPSVFEYVLCRLWSGLIYVPREWARQYDSAGQYFSLDEKIVSRLIAGYARKR